MHPFRSHHCNQLRASDINQTVRISGWVHRRRDHGNLVFIDVRDHYGITQCVINPESNLVDEASRLKFESVITVTGNVVARSPETVNGNMATGEIEVAAETLIVESEADMLPLQVNADREFPEETRLRYRFLDLRREKLHANIVLRSSVIAALRRKMTDRGFMEIQTPILTASSPEGARDFLVPSRLHPGKFYALPQAPQQFKQMLMVSGFDKYFQIAPCFRDEDARADRSPGEFYQLDMEMSFVTQDDVFAAIEPVLYEVFTEFASKKVTKPPFARITYKDSMLKYGCDKPDLRNPIEIADVTEIFRNSGFSIFVKSISNGSVVRAIPAPKVANEPRSFFDKKVAFAQEQGAGGLAYIIFGDDGVAKGPIAKLLKEEELQAIRQVAGLHNGDAVFFACDEVAKAADLAGKVRTLLGEELKLIPQDEFRFCWVVDFPFYEYNEERKHIDFSHNPFSMPQGGMDALLNQNPLDIVAFQYDIVCNGIELSSGAIRNHRPDIMIKAFEIAGYNQDAVEENFGGMLRAFRFGAPPHGGLAPGVDRMVMLLAGEPNIREVICFPMNQKAEDLLMGAPSRVAPKQLQELHIQLSHVAKKALEEADAETKVANQ
ncbi:MAG: aspartate--tRNA ligase [Alphaproteobacteria bacterium]|nr:aspartate--tRNA ligase [Alphaproteobacteria bacterium]